MEPAASGGSSSAVPARRGVAVWSVVALDQGHGRGASNSKGRADAFKAPVASETGKTGQGALQGAFSRGVPLTLSGVVLFFLFLAVAAPSCFFAGVMCGRSRPVEPVLLDAPALSKAGEGDSGGILSGADLDFSRMLHADSDGKAGIAGASVSLLDSSFKGKQDAPHAVAEGPPEPSRYNSQTGQEGVPKAAESQKPLFDYVFQIAAYRIKEHAERQRAALSSKGLHVKIRQSGKMLVVLLPLRGPEEAASGLASTLKRMGFGSPMVLSKKPVARGAVAAR